MITIDMVMAANPCEDYSRARVKKLFGKRETLTAKDIAELKIPIDDKLWALVHLCLTDEQCKQFASACLERINETIPDTTSAKLLAMNAAEKAAWTLAKIATWPPGESPIVSFKTKENRYPIFDETRLKERQWQIDLAVWFAEQEYANEIQAR